MSEHWLILLIFCLPVQVWKTPFQLKGIFGKKGAKKHMHTHRNNAKKDASGNVWYPLMENSKAMIHERRDGKSLTQGTGDLDPTNLALAGGSSARASTDPFPMKDISRKALLPAKKAQLALPAPPVESASDDDDDDEDEEEDKDEGEDDADDDQDDEGDAEPEPKKAF